MAPSQEEQGPPQGKPSRLAWPPSWQCGWPGERGEGLLQEARSSPGRPGVLGSGGPCPSHSPGQRQQQGAQLGAGT